MADGWAVLDGTLCALDEATIPITDLALRRGWSVFDTLLAIDGELVQSDPHLQRLAESCRQVLIAMPSAALLLKECALVARRVGGAAQVRMTLTASGRRIVTAEPIDLHKRWRSGVHACRGVHSDEPYLGGSVKHASRIGWMVATTRAGTDDLLLVDGSGRFTEATTAAVLAVIDGALWTAPFDGRILVSTVCSAVLEQAERLEIPVVRQGPRAAGPWDALYVASSTRGLAPVLSLDGVALPPGDPVGQRLWQSQPPSSYLF